MANDTPVSSSLAFADEHRRVLGHLSHPRSLVSLARVLDDDDGAPTLGIASMHIPAHGMPSVEAVLMECEAAGWAKNVGDIRNAKALADIPNGDDSTIDIAPEDADVLRRRARTGRGRTRYLDEGDKYILTRDGLARLTDPQDPATLKAPLTGAALLGALTGNVALAQETVVLERAAVADATHTQTQLDAALQVLALQEAALAAYVDPEEEDE